MSTLLRRFQGEFQVVFVGFCSGLLIQAFLSICGGVGDLRTNLSGCWL